MAKVTIGAHGYLISELNFNALEKSWDAIQDVLQIDNADPIMGVAVALRIIGAALQEEEYFSPVDFGIDGEEAKSLTVKEMDAAVLSFLKKKLKAKEIANLSLSIMDIIEEAGLLPDMGEAREALLALGTEAFQKLSQNSSPQESKEVPGTP